MNPRSNHPVYDRRRALAVLGGGIGTLVIAACSGDESSTASSTMTGGDNGSMPTTANTDVVDPDSAPECAPIPEETAGPFPGDGSNGPDVLSIEGVERRDIRTSIGNATGSASGLKLTIELTVVDSSNGCKPLPGAAVYLWHADSVGRYSMYSNGVTAENYLRGVQVTDADGNLSFVSVFPGCYEGRWPHVHFEVYASMDDLKLGNPLATSQLAFPEAACSVAYTTDGYEDSAPKLSRVSLESDLAFRDGFSGQLAVVSGDITEGFTASLTVVV